MAALICSYWAVPQPTWWMRRPSRWRSRRARRGDLDPEAGDLLGQRLRQAFERPLGRVVAAENRERGDPTDGRDLDDVTVALLAHDRDDRLGDVERAEQVDVQLCLQLRRSQLLDRAEQAIAGVVGHDVDTAERLSGARDRGEHALAVRDVQGDGEDCIPVLGDQVGQHLRIAAVAPTLSLRPRAAFVNSLPNLRPVPAMNHTLLMCCCSFLMNNRHSTPNLALSVKVGSW